MRHEFYFRKIFLLFLIPGMVLIPKAWAFRPGEEVEVYSAPITGLACAFSVQKSGKLEDLALCPPAEALKGYAAYDITFGQAYVIAPKNVRYYELEKAFGGGSIDFHGVIVGQEKGVPVVELRSYTLKEKPKAGNFKGCM